MNRCLLLLLAAGLLCGCATFVTRAEANSYLADWKDDSAGPSGLYRSYSDNQGVTFGFERIDDEGTIHGNCSFAEFRNTSSCRATLRGDTLLLLYCPWCKGTAGTGDPDEHVKFMVAQYRVSGNTLTCSGTAWGNRLKPTLAEVRWSTNHCYPGHSPNSLTAANDRRVGDTDAPEQEEAAPPPSGGVETGTAASRLEELNEMLQKGLITQDDYDLKKQQILEGM